MMPQPPHHKEDQPRGLTDQTVDAAHDFMEHAEEDRDKVRPDPFISNPSSLGFQVGEANVALLQAEQGKRSSLGAEDHDKSMLEQAKETAKEKLNLGGQTGGGKY